MGLEYIQNIRIIYMDWWLQWFLRCSLLGHTGTDQEYCSGRKCFSFSILGTELTNIFLKSDSLPQLVALVVSSPCRDEIDPNKNLEKQKAMECHTLTKLVKLFISNANSFLVWPKTSQSTQKSQRKFRFLPSRRVYVSTTHFSFPA